MAKAAAPACPHHLASCGRSSAQHCSALLTLASHAHQQAVSVRSPSLHPPPCLTLRTCDTSCSACRSALTAASIARNTVLLPAWQGRSACSRRYHVTG